MRKITYIIFLAVIIVGIVGYIKIQQLKNIDFEFSKIISFVKNGPCGFDVSKASIKSAEGRNAIRKSNIMQISFAINEFKRNTGNFPNINKMSGSLTAMGIFSSKQELNPIVPEYLDAPLIDPINNSEYYYSYFYDRNKKNYLLFVRLEPQYSGDAGKQYYCVDNFIGNPMLISHNPSASGRCGE